jgi:hypothetical protein
MKDSAQVCDFKGYEADALMKETPKLRKLITERYTGNKQDLKNCKEVGY